MLEADLFIEGIERELSSVVCAAQGGHIAPHHTGVRLAIILTVPLPILLHNLQEHSTSTGPGVNVAQQKEAKASGLCRRRLHSTMVNQKSDCKLLQSCEQLPAPKKR